MRKRAVADAQHRKGTQISPGWPDSDSDPRRRPRRTLLGLTRRPSSRWAGSRLSFGSVTATRRRSPRSSSESESESESESATDSESEVGYEAPGEELCHWGDGECYERERTELDWRRREEKRGEEREREECGELEVGGGAVVPRVASPSPLHPR